MLSGYPLYGRDQLCLLSLTAVGGVFTDFEAVSPSDLRFTAHLRRACVPTDLKSWRYDSEIRVTVYLESFARSLQHHSPLTMACEGNIFSRHVLFDSTTKVCCRFCCPASYERNVRR